MKRSLTAIVTLIAIFALLAPEGYAQSPTPNIATQATCTHSGGGATTYAPSNYNDGIIAAPGSLPWGWTSGSSGAGAWIMFEWPTPRTFGEITLYYGGINNRYLAGSAIEVWNTATSTWYTHHTWSTTVYTDWTRVIQFPPATSTRMRIIYWTMAPVGQTSNPNFREIEIRNICTDPPTIVDFTAPATTTQPAVIPVSYHIERPYGDFLATITFRFFTPTGNLVLTETTQVPFTGGSIDNVYNFQSTSLPPGFYRLEVTFNVFDICNALADVKVNKVVMVLAPGQVACEVWPGDATNDGVVNYGDRKALNTYIHDANLNAQWLNGPARYRADAAENPLTFIQWEAQPSVPWFTPTGCYMDCDGNGVVNNFDFIVMKMNWMKTHGPGDVFKQGESFSVNTFDVGQNFPNPFNPTTQIKYNVPEPSNVRIIVLDMLGREVATLVNGTVQEGVHTVNFDASGLGSGAYVAVATLHGIESGQDFTKTIRMTLSK